MASEYLNKLAREQEIEQKRELTQKEKRQNWWHYHKWHVVLCVLAVLLVGNTIWEIVFNKGNVPDYQVGFIGSDNLPADTVTALETALEALGEDLNGDGQVLVRVNQYLLNVDDANYMVSYGAQAQLMADTTDYQLFYFLMEDPKRFQEQYGLLAYPDGTVPNEFEEISEELWLSWAECPGLTGLPLGSFTLEAVDENVTGDSQELLSGLYVARRAVWSEAEFEDLEGFETLWEKLIGTGE